ncbi:hypothetical protein [Nosocomiicoccus ampullae]|uniref:hypothetical protein n=1 Tax=Nosocomiicoccus ampullae TaxID=489910 RepID=UPI0025517338|nr:hypothetical protein [Nosocomiicoccus ampullae]MDK6863123.1 hypothetical protein [Nosocomiicoccus ampullae]
MNNLTSHPRFIKKIERDLKALYHDNDFDLFIEKFSEYSTIIDHIDITLVEMYYDVLIQKNEYEKMYKYAQLCFQTKEMSRDEAELHLNMILQALFNLELYEELLEWSNIVTVTGKESGMAASLIQFATHCKHYATEELKKRNTMTQPNENNDEVFNTVDIDIDEYLNAENPTLVIAAVEHLIDLKDETYGDDVYKLLQSERDMSVASLMVIYLKEIEYDGVIHLEKFGETFDAHTSEFKQFEKSAKVEPTIRWIVEEGQLRFDHEERIQQAIEIFLNISLLWYPLKVPFTPKELAKGFISYTKMLNNELPMHSFNGFVADWILKIEKEIHK